LLSLVLAAGAASADAQAPVISESQIKAAFLYNFTKFVEWPAEVFPNRNHPIAIGILGENPLVAELQMIVENRKVNGRTIVVINVLTPADIAATQLLFVSADEDARFADLKRVAQDNAVLTVGESPSFAAAGGAIFFVQQNGKLRFEINIAAAERARLKISAELQKLATAVSRTP
jgi:hypothetical protein